MNLTTGTINANGTRLHYYRTGGDKPPLVLLHGITDDGLCWLPVAEQVADRFDVVMLDFRGHGRSEAPEGGYDLETLAVETAEFIRGLGLEKPVLLGHSMGAITALVLVGLYPEMPRAILLEDPPAFWRPDRAGANDAELRAFMHEWMRAIKRKTREELFVEGRRNAAWSDAELAPWVDSKLRFDEKVIALAAPPDLSVLDLPGLFRRIKCPAWLIYADQVLGAIIGEGEVKTLKEWIPQLRVEHVPGAGHNIRREQFERYMAVIQKALSDILGTGSKPD